MWEFRRYKQCCPVTPVKLQGALEALMDCGTMGARCARRWIIGFSFPHKETSHGAAETEKEASTPVVTVFVNARAVTL